MEKLTNTATICARLLASFGVASAVKLSEIDNLRTYQSQLYARGAIYSFGYKGTKFYVIDDYSLNDNPVYIANILSDINTELNGELIANPVPQSDRARYAAGLEGVEYYLWKCA